MIDKLLRVAYLYARNNGCTDSEAAKFADWFVGSAYNVAQLREEFSGWLDRSLSDA